MKYEVKEINEKKRKKLKNIGKIQNKLLKKQNLYKKRRKNKKEKIFYNQNLFKNSSK